MIELGGCRIYRPKDYESHYVGVEDSSCFYFSPFSLDDLARDVKQAGQSLVARIVRIEVRDTEADMHAHAGATIVYIAFGSGVFKTIEGDVPVRAGDWVYVPPHVPHLSIADKGTVMPEVGIYIGEPDDPQKLYPVTAKASIQP